MSFLFSHWKDEESPEQKYNSIIGSDNTIGRTEKELLKDIELSINNNYTSRQERKSLLNLFQEINKPNQSD